MRPGASSPIRLQLLDDARDAEGQPRAGLLVQPSAATLSRRPVLMIFPSLGAAVQAKRDMEARR